MDLGDAERNAAQAPGLAPRRLSPVSGRGHRIDEIGLVPAKRGPARRPNGAGAIRPN